MNERIKRFESDMIQWRHELHQNPETAFEEYETSRYIAERLEEFGLSVNRGLAKTGVVGTLNHGYSDAHSAIALRADMDALDLSEANSLPYKSKKDGKMHACGHDGHMAMLLGAAKILAESRTFKGTVHFIFQPAEENEGGGGKMVEEGLFKKYPVKAVFGMHNFPAIPAGFFAIRPGPMMAAYDVFDITVNGKGGHAAMPHLAKDPIVASAHIVNQLQSIVSRNTIPVEAAVVSVTQIHGGTAYNIIPENVSIKGTTRHFSPEIQNMVQSRIHEIVNGVTHSFGISAHIDYQRRYPTLVNSPSETDQVVGIASKLVGADHVIADMPQIMGSEDFAFMLQEVPGAYIGIGSGSQHNTANLHNDCYDFNDDILSLGVGYWISLVETLLKP